MELHEPDPEELERIALILQQAIDPAANMSEAQKGELELLQIVQKSFNFDDVLRRMADLSEGKAARSKAEVFASGVVATLVTSGYMSFPNRITELSVLHTVAHWFATYERYLEQGEV